MICVLLTGLNFCFLYIGRRLDQITLLERYVRIRLIREEFVILLISLHMESATEGSRRVVPLERRVRLTLIVM